MGIKIEGIDEAIKSIKDLPKNIMNDFEEYFNKIIEQAMKNCGNKIDFKVTRNEKSFEFTLKEIDKTKHECVKKAIEQVNPPFPDAKKMLEDWLEEESKKLENT